MNNKEFIRDGIILSSFLIIFATLGLIVNSEWLVILIAGIFYLTAAYILIFSIKVYKEKK